MKKLAALLLLTAFLLPALPQAGFAQDMHHDRDRGGHHDRWHGDIRHFRDHDLARWHGGHWFHGPHGGRNGWWWTVGSSFYFYPAPIYPYPDPFVPPLIAPAAAPVVAPAPVIGAPVAAVPASYWYYCRSPRGYYPYVAACARPWRLVPVY